MAPRDIAEGPERRQQGIQSVEIGMRLLGAVESGGGPATLSELAGASGMPPNKAHRYLVSLMRAGLVIQDSVSGRYDLGPAARRLGLEALRRSDEVSIASARVVALRDETGHTVNLSIWTDAGPTIVRWDTGWHALAVTFRVGSVLPLLESSVGRVFLSHLPPAQTRAILADQQKNQLTGSMDAGAVQTLIAEVVGAGAAYTSSSLIPGLAAIAAPVMGSGNQLLMVVGVALPARLLRARALSKLQSRLVAVAEEISRSLGHVPE